MVLTIVADPALYLWFKGFVHAFSLKFGPYNCIRLRAPQMNGIVYSSRKLAQNAASLSYARLRCVNRTRSEKSWIKALPNIFVETFVNSSNSFVK